MLNLPTQFLNPSMWLGLKVDALYSAYADGQIHPQSMDRADAVYQPSSMIPSVVLCRISESEKRLEQALESNAVVDGSWGVLHEVLGQGAIIGAAITIKEGVFMAAHVLPDMVHLVSMLDDVPHDSIMKSQIGRASCRERV
jgi:hypothetical protein